jgi:hypothetical protein
MSTAIGHPAASIYERVLISLRVKLVTGEYTQWCADDNLASVCGAEDECYDASGGGRSGCPH